jgi:chromosome segregation ATPase
MKTKVVLWGENADNEKILIGIELLERDNKILIHTIPHKAASEDFYQNMVNKWRENQDINWPDAKTTIERPLSVSDSLLPDDIKVERTDIIAKAQAEWHFVVLSTKLYEAYKEELDELKGKVDSLAEYSESQWSELVEFWNKVSNHLKERTLFKDQGATLKERANILFDKLKELKKRLHKEADEKSKEAANELLEELNKINEKITEGLGFGPIFDELKAIQNKYNSAKLNNRDKGYVFNKIDAAFKALKSNKGNKPEKDHKSSEQNHITNRLTGLVDAIKRMENSIRRDQQEIDFQQKRIGQTEGKLELQLREAKMKMIETGLSSKKEKLDDMLNTRNALEAKLKSFEEKKLKRDAEQKVKEKIAVGIEEQKEKLESESEKLETAAAEISASKGNKFKAIVADIIDEVKEISEEVVQTTKAIIEVAEDKIEDLKDSFEEKVEKVEEDAEELKDGLEEKVEAFEEKAEDIKDNLEEKVEAFEEKAEGIKDNLEEKVEAFEEKIEDIVDNIIDKGKEIIEDIKVKISDLGADKDKD